MSFAATDYSITLKDVRQIYITNHTKKDLKGFKLYYYFNSQPVKDLKELKEKITRYVANTSTSGKYVSESALQNIMNGSDFTVYNVIKWTGAKLSKSAADVAESPISAEQPLYRED